MIIDTTIGFYIIGALMCLITVLSVLLVILKKKGQAEAQAEVDLETLFVTGNRYYEEYKYREALECYLQVVKLEPGHLAANFKIARIYMGMEQYAKAEEIFTRLIQYYPDSDEIIYELARVYFNQGRFEEALERVERLLKLVSEHLDGMKLKCRILAELNRWSKLIPLAQDILTREPENVDMLFLLGKAFQMEKRFEDALKAYHTLLEQDKRDKRDLKYQIYLIYEYQGLHDEAIAILENIMKSGTGTVSNDKIKSELVACWCRKGHEQLRLNQFTEALACFDIAATYDKNNAEVFRGKAKVYARQEKNDLALQFYQKALEAGPDSSIVHMELAKLYEKTNQIPEAIEVMLQAEAYLPTAKVYYYLGTLYGESGDLDHCIHYLRLAIEKDPRFTDAYYNLGVALEHQHNLKEALNMYKRAMELDKTHHEAKTNFKYLQNRLQGKLV